MDVPVPNRSSGSFLAPTAKNREMQRDYAERLKNLLRLLS